MAKGFGIEVVGEILKHITDARIDYIYSSGGNLNGLDESVAKSIADSAINGAALNLPGEVIDQAALIESSVSAIKKIDNQTVVDCAGYVRDQLNGLSLGLKISDLSWQSSSEISLAKNLSSGIFGFVHQDAANQLTILADLEMIRAYEIKGMTYSKKIEIINSIKNMDSPIYTGSGPRPTTYRSFADTVAKMIGIVDWANLAPKKQENAVY